MAGVPAASGLIGLRAKVITHGVLSESDIEKLVLMKLEEELHRLGVRHDYAVRVKSTYQITPRQTFTQY
ncbi:hypothetical protein AOLI_G00325580 [Acnodon oligacanthus]